VGLAKSSDSNPIHCLNSLCACILLHICHWMAARSTDGHGDRAVGVNSMFLELVGCWGRVYQCRHCCDRVVLVDPCNRMLQLVWGICIGAKSSREGIGLEGVVKFAVCMWVACIHRVGVCGWKLCCCWLKFRLVPVMLVCCCGGASKKSFCYVVLYVVFSTTIVFVEEFEGITADWRKRSIIVVRCHRWVA